MVQDNDKLHGVVEISVKLTDTRGAHQQSTAIVTRGFTLSEVGTVLQRETYELLRLVAEGQTEADAKLDSGARLAEYIGQLIENRKST
jgi:hypothetical protein